MESVLILGAGLMQKPAILSAKSNGYKTFVIDADKNAICGTENNSKATLTYKFEGGKAPYILSVQRTEDGGVTETITPSNLSATGTYTLQPTTKTTAK